MKENFISVYIPTYNRLELLKRAIDSVLKQTYQNFEIIIVDDCSTDGTPNYLVQLAQENSKVKFFLKEKNGGACESRNIAIQHAQGELITGLDDDDYFLPNRLQDFINHWQNKPKNTIGLSSFYGVQTKSGIVYGKKHLKRSSIQLNNLLLANVVGNQIFTKTDTLRKLKGFDQNLKCWQDLELWMRILNQGNIEKIQSWSYIVDVSHDSERIGDSQHQKYVTAAQYISNKLYLSPKQVAYLGLQTYNCKGVTLKYIDIIKVFLKYPSLSLFIYLIKAIILQGVRAVK